MAEEVQAPQEEITLDDLQEVAPDQTVETLLAELGTQAAAVQLHRFDEETGEKRYLGRVSVDIFGLEHVRKRFGGGKYQARFVDAKAQYLGQSTFLIEGEPRITPGPESTGNGPAADAVNEIREHLLRLQNPPPQAAGAPADQMFLTLLAATKEMMVPMTELLKDMKEEIRSARKGSGEGPTPTETLQIITDSVKLGMKLNKGDPQPNAYAGVVENVGVPLVGLLKDLAERERAEPKPQGSTMAERPIHPTIGQFLHSNMAMLLDQAERDIETSEVAVTILANVPQPFVSTLQSEVVNRADDFLRSIFVAFPATVRHSGWFQDLVLDLESALSQNPGTPNAEEIVVETAPVDGSTQDSEGGSGNEGDPPADGTPSE